MPELGGALKIRTLSLYQSARARFVLTVGPGLTTIFTDAVAELERAVSAGMEIAESVCVPGASTAPAAGYRRMRPTHKPWRQVE